jgi:hypothetical protein
MFRFCSGMSFRPPIHHRDFALDGQQVTLAEAPVDADGLVWFRCLKCPRTGKVRLARLQARFAPTEGLVNILNALAPKDCPLAGADPWGNHLCGFCYRDLGRRPEG